MAILKSRDISPSGIGLYSDEPLEVGKVYSITLCFGEPASVDVTVVRCVGNEDDNRAEFPYFIGCKFNEGLPGHVLEMIRECPVKY